MEEIRMPAAWLFDAQSFRVASEGKCVADIWLEMNRPGWSPAEYFKIVLKYQIQSKYYVWKRDLSQEGSCKFSQNSKLLGLDLNI